MAFNNLPLNLVRSESSVFGDSGEGLKEMKKSYFESTMTERTEHENIITMLMANFKEPKTITFIPIIDINENTKEDDTINQ